MKEQTNYTMKDIPGYEGLYAATTDGQIWSYKSKKFLKPLTCKNGYQSVNLYDIDKKMHTKSIHRLVMITLNPIEGMENLDVNHINEDKTDNRLENLEWLTRKENINYGTRNKRIGKANSKKIYCEELNRVFNSLSEAAKELDFSVGNISSCCTGRYKQTNGYHFCFWSE